MRLGKALFGDPGVKLLAILIAVTLWFIVRKDLRDEKPVQFEVKVIVDEPGEFETVILQPSDGRLKVRVAGPASEVAIFAAANPAGTVIARISGRDHVGADKTGTTVRLGLSDLEFPPAIDGGNLSVLRPKDDAPEVAVRVDRMVTKTVRLLEPTLWGKDKFEGTDFETGRWPPNLEVRGKMADLKDITEIKAHITQAELEILKDRLASRTSNEFTATLHLDELYAGRFELLEPNKFTVEIEVTSQQSRWLDVPLYIIYRQPGAAADALRLKFTADNKNEDWFRVPEDGGPPLVHLEFRGAPREVLKLDAAKMMAFVVADDLPDDRDFGTLPVHLDYQSVPRDVSCKLTDLEVLVEPE